MRTIQRRCPGRKKRLRRICAQPQRFEFIAQVANHLRGIQLVCGLQALADAATVLDLQCSTGPAPKELANSYLQQQQQQQETANTCLPISSPPRVCSVASVVPVAARTHKAMRQWLEDGADSSTGHLTPIQNSNTATANPSWQLPIGQLRGIKSCCTMSCAHFRGDLSPQIFGTAVVMGTGRAAATYAALESVDLQDALNAWRSGSANQFGAIVGQSRCDK